MQHSGVEQLLAILPEEVGKFKYTEYPLPIKSAFLGEKPIHCSAVRKDLMEKQNGDVKDLLEPLLLAAELYEASCQDNEQYFLTDNKVQSYVFSGSKWKAGWVLVLGGTNQEQLVAKLQGKNFLVFTDQPNLKNTVYIGGRATSPIYFLQLMVRYGMVWGRISVGDDHSLGHFLEKDMPGFIVIYKDLDPLKYLVALGLMKLGAPAVVPGTFPFPYGFYLCADTVDDIVEKGSRFPNLRQRYFKDEIISLPDYCNQASANETLKSVRSIGGTRPSFLCVHPVAKARRFLKTIGQRSNEIGILIEIAEKHFSDDIALIVEKTALKSLNYISGLRAGMEDQILRLDFARDSSINETMIADAIYWGIRSEYPRIKNIAVKIIYDHEELITESDKTEKYNKQRLDYIENMTEENTDIFCICTECRPFSLVHTCIVTPQRAPMCGSRTYVSIKAAAYFGSSTIPWQRQSEKRLPLRSVCKKGRVINSETGEYEGANKVYRKMTHGKLKRVYLHSLREFPHTSCGCFQALAFWIESVQGIGIISRNSTAVTPDGQTWEKLANRAAGKQSLGITGISLEYIRSKSFLRGDGGLSNVVWADSALYAKIKDLFPLDQKVATEKLVHSIAELTAFLGR
ncbi:MAG: hypothetical protein ACYS1A_12630 [Planctomycetota bacterium]